MTVYLKSYKEKETSIYNDDKATSGNNIKSSSVSGAYYSLVLLRTLDHPLPLTKMHFVLDRLRSYTVLSINLQFYHACLFLHFIHPITAIHVPAETFPLWFCSHKLFLSSLTTGKWFGKPIPLFVEGESFD